MKKVLFIIKSLKDRAGSERVAINLANLFNKHLGLEIAIINRDTIYKDVSYPLNNNIEVIKKSGNILSFFAAIQHIIYKEKPDYIIIHNMGRLSLLCSFLVKCGTKIYSLEHVSSNYKGKIAKILDKLCYLRLDKIITLTDDDLNNYSSWHNNVVKIHNISPYENININYLQDSKRIIAVGRLTKQKNFQALLKAWSILFKQLPDWTLEIYGKGEEKGNLENFINEENINNVFLKEPINDMASLYRSSAFIVMSSLYEGLPMTLIEAQTFGLPIISFNCPNGPSEIIVEHENGILIENQNIKELSDAILYLVKNKNIRAKMSKNAVITSVRFSKEIILQKWKAILK